MSAALLDEYNVVDNLIEDEKQEVLAQRSHILETASRKAQNRTLTLQETTDLYAKFNRTYESSVKRALHKEDESWALKLLKDCEEESPNNRLDTKINGEPIVNSEIVSSETSEHITVEPVKKVLSLKSETPKHLPNSILEDHYSLVTEEEKTTIRDLFIYDQFEAGNKYKRGIKSHKSFIIVMSVSVVLTLSGLIGISLFL